MYRLAAIFPHPDDESLFAGGLLARAARTGAAVRVLSLTHGEAGGSRTGECGPGLARRRATELSRAREVLGTLPPTLWTWPDGGLTGRDAERSISRIAAWLREHAPQVVVSFGPDGAYGHVDHVRCATWVQVAVEHLGPGVRLLQPAFEPDTFSDLRRGLRRFAPRLLAPASEAQSATQPPQVVLSLDPSERELKRSAIAAHDSQLPGGDVDRFLAPGLVRTLCLRERYHIAGGPGLSHVTDDPFEGLV